MEKTLPEIVDTVRNAQGRGGTCLLIGAGCSLTGGVPLASGFVDLIKKRFPAKYGSAPSKDYPECMAQLGYAERRDLIVEAVERARINPAHLAIAQLVRGGYVERILTTNFDPLLLRACAAIDVFPSVYDIAASQMFRPSDVLGKAIFHLHGQHSGFVLLNTEQEVGGNRTLLEPVFEDAGRDRSWIVVGYSGHNDPVFDLLAQTKRFDRNLYWVGYGDEDPAVHVRTKLLASHRYAFFVRGFDADRFFMQLAQQLEVFPPRFVAAPFSYLSAKLETLAPVQLKVGHGDVDHLDQTRQLVKRAVDRYEGSLDSDGRITANTQPTAAATMAESLLMAGNYEQLISLKKGLSEDQMDEVKGAVSWAFVMQGLALQSQAKTKEGEEADGLSAAAGEKYAAALEIKPDMHEALYNWGLALQSQAETKEGEEADGLFAAAGEKYAAALEIKPDKHEALSNWGLALQSQAETKEGEEADGLFAAAGEKYAAALEIKPDMHEALYNWGLALQSQAETKEGEEADGLFAAAGEKYAAALEIKPDMHEALSNWGLALQSQAETKEGEEADGLSAAAGEKYAAALEIKPDKHEALYNWGNALQSQAETKEGEEADGLFAAAGEKYAAALEIKPDKHEALYNWGLALQSQAETKEGEEADGLSAAAGEKYAAALEIKPDKHEALSNWGLALQSQAKTKEGEEADALYQEARVTLERAGAVQAGAGAYNLACLEALQDRKAQCRKWLQVALKQGVLPTTAHLQEDSDLDSVREEKWFDEILAAAK